MCARHALLRAHSGTESRLARAADLARAAVEKECPAELLEAAFGLPRCVAMLLSCAIVLRLLIALAAEVCWRSKSAQAAACGHEGTLEQLSAGCRRLRMARGASGRCALPDTACDADENDSCVPCCPAARQAVAGADLKFRSVLKNRSVALRC